MRRRSLPAVCIVLLLRAAGARAECPAPLTLSGPDAGGILTVIGSTSGACGSSRLDFRVTGPMEWSRPPVSCDTPDCSITFPIDTICWPTGTYTMHLATTCHSLDGGGSCSIEDHGSNSRTFSIDSTPVIDVSFEPDSHGDGTVTVTYSFPNERPEQFRFIRTYVDGVFSLENAGLPISGTWTYPYSVRCRSPGPHTLRAVGTGCAPAQNGEDSTPVTVSPATSISGSWNPATQNLKIDYVFGNTGGDPSGARSMTYSVNGGAEQAIGMPDCLRPEGHCTQPLTFACDSGPHDVVLHARSCSATSGPYTAVTSFRATPEPCGKDTRCGPPPLSTSLLDRSASPGCDACVGAPVNVGSGDVSLNIPLFTIDAAPSPLPFGLAYHSMRPTLPDMVSVPLGKGWTHTFNMSLRPISPHRLQLHTADGHRDFFDQVSSSLWTASKPTTVRDQVALVGSTYVLQYYGGGSSTFDATTGRWLSTADRWGNAITGGYTGNDLTSITDAYGRVVTLAYAGGWLDSITLPGGATWRFAYDGSGKLWKIFDPLHTGATPWRKLAYVGDETGDPWLLSEMRDEADKLLEGHWYGAYGPNGFRGTASFSESGRDSYVIDYDTPSAGKTRVTHAIDGASAEVAVYELELINGSYRPKRIDGVCASCGAVTDSQIFTMDTAGRMLTRTDGLGHVTKHDYDAMGRLIATTAGYGTPIARTTSYQYTYAPWPTFVTQISEPSVAGAAAKVTTRAWSGVGETVLTTIENATITRTTTFDARHRVVSEQGPRPGVVGSIAYSADGRMQSTTNAAGHVTTFSDYDAFGTARQVTDANGVVTTRVTDGRGRVTSTTNHAVPGDANETSDYTTSSTYDGRDRLIETTSARGTKTRFVYEDGTNRLLDTIRVDTSGNEVERRHVKLNVAGLKTAEEDQVCASPAASCGSWITKRSEAFVYDQKGRLVEIDHPVPAGSKSVYAYDADGRLQSVRDENHAAPNTTYAYDARERLTSVTQTLAGGSIVTSYGYDAHDNLTSVTDPNGNVTTYAYDDFGRMQKQTSPVTGVTSYSYDEAGNLTSSTNANGAQTVRMYDALNRPLSATSTRTGKPTEGVSWTYDDTSNGNYGRGRLTSMTDPTGSTFYRYERRGLLKREQKTPYVTTYGYDANGNRTSIGYPSGRTVTYGVDFADRPLSAAAGATSIVTSAGYLPFGPLTSIVYGNGTTKTFIYDARYCPLENKLTGPGGAIADYVYVTDPSGNITQIHDTVDPGYNRDFGYDDLNRLTAANTGASLWGAGSYAYDAMGNMLSYALGTSRTGSFTYVGPTPKIATVTENGVTRNVSYDAAGNETAVGSRASSYSSRNFLAGAGSASYGYDGRGVRAEAGFSKLDLTLSADHVSGSNTVTGTVLLAEPAPAGGATIMLSSSDTSVATVLASITIAAGATSGMFPVTTFAVPASATVAVTASWSSATAAANLLVLPGPWDVASLLMAPTDVLGTPFATSTGTVTLNAAAPTGGVRVPIAVTPDTDPPWSFSVVVPSGATSTTFSMTGHAPPTGQSCIGGGDCPQTYGVTATFATSASSCFVVHTVEGTLTICGGEGLRAESGPSALLGITLTPERVVAGRSVLITVQLTAPAPAKGMAIALSASNPAIVLPQHVVIPPGQRSATLEATTTDVEEDTPIHITAESLGIRRETTVVVTPTRPLFMTSSLVGTDSVSSDYKRHSRYTPELHLLTETNTSTTPTLAHEYIWFADIPVAQYDLATATTHWTFTDHLGTPILQTDATGTVDWRAEYEPYGQVFAYRAGATRHQPLRFPGQEYDDATPQREYNIFRWYRAGWGRYMAVDPLELPSITAFTSHARRRVGRVLRQLPQLQHQYLYVAARPTSLADPLGLFVSGPSPLSGPGALALFGAKTCFADGPQPGPADALGLFLIASAVVWANIENELERAEHLKTCKPCRQKIDDCLSRCDKAYQALIDDCKRRFPGTSRNVRYLRELCYAEAAEVYADCLKDCYGMPLDPHLP